MDKIKKGNGGGNPGSEINLASGKDSDKKPENPEGNIPRNEAKDTQVSTDEKKDTMEKKDTAEKEFVSYPDVAADFGAYLEIHR